jgi:pimeloyl-ACP methyl ester carboxylesterase
LGGSLYGKPVAKFDGKQGIICKFAPMKHIFLHNGRNVAIYFIGKKLAPGAIPLVLIHGFCEDASLWNTLAPHLTEIPVVAIDLPGFGGSDVPESPVMAEYAGAVIAVLDHLAVNRCVLVGHSLGGYTALAFAAGWGDRLAGLGLFHAHPYPDHADRKAVRMRGIAMLEAGKRNLFVAQLFPNLFTTAFALKHPEILQKMVETGQRQSAEGISAALLAMMSRLDHQETLRTTSYPVLFLLGDEDGLVPLTEAWKAALLPDFTSITILPNVAHMGMFEAPEASAAALMAFYALSKSKY